MKYDVTEAGHMLSIGGKRRKAGETITLSPAEAEFEVLRETVVEHKVEAKPEADAKVKK